jgi:tetratricopeptide (TPR) repeat protein
MGELIQFKYGFQRIQATYTIREISRQFGLSEHYIRRWTREGLIRTAPSSSEGEPRFDFRALKTFRQVRELRHRGMTVRQIAAELHGQLNLFTEPEGQLIRLPLSLSPFEAALLMHEHGDRAATEAYRKAIREDDCVPDAYCNVGILEFDAGRRPMAFDCFTLALRYDPRHFESHFNLANLYFECGDLRLARLHYELAAEIEPNFSNLYFNLGLVHAINGEIEEAIAALRTAKEKSPEQENVKVDEFMASLLKISADTHVR